MPKHTRDESGDEKQAAKKAKPEIKRPPKDHPIYGERGIMRGILWYTTKTGSSTKLDPEYQVKDARVYGNNGIAVGAWWPRQLAAKRDGAHLDSQAGISGTPETGAWSIVVKGGGYKGLDKDTGDSITYSAPGASDTKSKTAESESRGAKCLLKSLENKQPVRVLRGEKTGWNGAPHSGLRYDGLYIVEGKEEGTNKKGGAYISFKLVRVKEQDPIKKKKCPNKAERDQEEKVIEGY